jgi:hypothetical protein
MESSDKTYTGFEINIVKLMFKKLNLSAEYNIASNKEQSCCHLFTQIVERIEPESSDFAIGILPVTSHTILVAEATNPYLHMKVSWYVPCPNPASR